MFKFKKVGFLFLFLLLIFLNNCVGSSTIGVFGSGVSVALDPRTLGTQIDDSIMQKNLIARLALIEKIYPVSYTHLRAHETPEHLVCRLLLEKKKNKTNTYD